MQKLASMYHGGEAQLLDGAKERLAHPTDELMSEVFREHQLHLTRVSDSQFEGTASIPLFGGGEGGPLVPRPDLVAT